MKEVDWTECIFCQDDKALNLHSIMVMEFSDKVLKLSGKDLTMRVRLAGIHDLVAADGKYHLKCWVYFSRKVSSNIQGEPSSASLPDPCMDTLCCEIQNGLQHGHVYDMADVWKEYLNLCQAANFVPPQKYISRRNHLTMIYKKILVKYAHQFVL